MQFGSHVTPSLEVGTATGIRRCLKCPIPQGSVMRSLKARSQMMGAGPFCYSSLFREYTVELDK